MDQNLGKIPWAIKSNEIQKIILLGTACIIRRFLSIERNTRLAPQERPTNGPGSMRAQEAINSTNNSKNNDYNNTNNNTTTTTATANNNNNNNNKRATRGARNPNLQVVIALASHGLPLRMYGMHRTHFSDHARLDISSLAIWSRVFWPSVTWKVRKAQRWSKSVLTFDRCLAHSVTFGYY